MSLLNTNKDSRTILKLLMKRRDKGKRKYKWEAIGYEASTTDSFVNECDDTEVNEISESGKSTLLENNRTPSLQPYVKFRRAARAVKSILQVCRVCKEYVFISNEYHALFASNYGQCGS